jgi:hypothetical protein
MVPSTFVCQGMPLGNHTPDQSAAPTNITAAIGVQYFKQVFIT